MNKFSVLMSIYYNEKPEFLTTAVKSVYSNSLKPSEIIIIKDGAIPTELEKALNHLCKNISIIKVFGYEKNMGLGYALNFGLEKCCNEIIFRMDADDICKKNRFESQFNFISKHDDISILGSSIEEFNEKPGDLKIYRKVPITQLEINKRKLFRCPFNHMTVCFKKSHILEVGGYSHMPGYEDYYLWLRVLKFYKAHNLEKPLVFARVGNNMLGRRQGFTLFINEIRFQKAIYTDGIQSFISFITNVILRGLPRLLPKFALKIVYKYFLRN